MAKQHYTRRELALKMIPVLVRWAQASWDQPHYYEDLSIAIGYGSNQIGGILGVIKDILDEVSNQYDTRIPPLNALVQSKKSHLPADGFDYVIPNYSSLSSASKSGEVRKLNNLAHLYDWDWVLNALGLEPAKIFSDEDIQKLKTKALHGYGKGEGEQHKSLKRYIASHPDSIGIHCATFIETEYTLPSGDRLDVFIEQKNGDRWAVEVKPSTSSDEDVTRGIFQCVKYTAVMNALRTVEYRKYENYAILVIGGKMSEQNKKLANDLRVRYIDNFIYHSSKHDEDIRE